MSIESWVALVAALTILAISPGPAWAAVVTTSIARGFVPAMVMSLGIALGDLVFLGIAIFGLALLAEALGVFFALVKFVGAAYLIYLGIMLWRHPPTAPASSRGQKMSLGGPFLTGFTLTLGNPKVIAFYLGFLPAFLDMTAFSAQDLTLVSLTVFAVISGVLIAYAALASRSRRLLDKEKSRQVLGKVLGTTLIGTGIVIAIRP